MIIKIVGMVLVMVSASLIGCCVAQCFAARERELYNLADAVELMINELEYSLEPIKFIFYKVQPYAKGAVSDLYDIISQYINEGMSASDAWQKALEKHAHSMCLKKSDCEFLKSCSDVFYAYEAEQQRLQLQLLKKKIEQLGGEAKNTRKKNDKLAKMLGVYGGVLLCAMLF